LGRRYEVTISHGSKSTILPPKSKHDHKPRNNSADYSKRPLVNQDRIEYLYQTGIERSKKYEKLTKEKQEQDKLKEVENCTFKPQIYSTYKKHLNPSVYERQKYWKNQIDER
jgi:hypothetical protein